MKVGSLFSGVGGFDYGLERAGMQIVWQSEIEPYCCEVLKKHWPDVPNLGDIFSIKDPPAVDLICGGFPCQPFSVAGKRQGKADDRYIWPQTIRVIRHVKPRWIVLENVTGLASMVEQIGKTKVESKTLQRLSQSDFYKGVFTRQELLLLAVIIQDIEKAGYQLPQLKDKTPVIPVIPACALNAPHRRDRIWILAGRQDGDDPKGRGCRVLHTGDKWQGKVQVDTSANTDRHAPHSEHDRCDGKEVRVSPRGSQQAPIDPSGTDRHAPDTESREAQSTEQGGLHAEFGGKDRDAPDTDGQRSQRYRQFGECTRECPIGTEDWQIPWSEVATNLLRMDDGISSGFHLYFQGVDNAPTIKNLSRQNLQDLWDNIQQKEVSKRMGGLWEIPQEGTLFPILCELERRTDGSDHLSLSGEMLSNGFLRTVWVEGKSRSASHQWRYSGEHRRKHADLVPSVPYEIALEIKEAWDCVSHLQDAIRGNRVKRLKALGNAIVPQIAEEIGRMILEIDSKNLKEKGGPIE